MFLTLAMPELPRRMLNNQHTGGTETVAMLPDLDDAVSRESVESLSPCKRFYHNSGRLGTCIIPFIVVFTGFISLFFYWLLAAKCMAPDAKQRIACPWQTPVGLPILWIVAVVSHLLGIGWLVMLLIWDIHTRCGTVHVPYYDTDEDIRE